MPRPTTHDDEPPPTEGEPLPRAAEAFGVRVKLKTYSLDLTHPDGGHKALGFKLILGITVDAIDYLESQIMARILDTPVSEIRDNPPYGINCVVNIQVRGIGAHADRVINVRTAWLISTAGDAPRLVSAYPKP